MPKEVTLDNYVPQALVTESNIQEVLDRTWLKTPHIVRLLHAGMGMVTESGEFHDALKKHIFYDKPLDRTNLIEELGDAMWYIAIACDALDISLQEVMQLNVNKLHARYGEHFSTEDALDRDLDNEEKVLKGE